MSVDSVLPVTDPAAKLPKEKRQTSRKKADSKASVQDDAASSSLAAPEPTLQKDQETSGNTEKTVIKEEPRTVPSDVRSESKEKGKKRKRDQAAKGDSQGTPVEDSQGPGDTGRAEGEPQATTSAEAPPTKKQRVRQPKKPPTAPDIEGGRAKALEYAREYKKHKKNPEQCAWKFNKTRQIWLAKYVWNADAIPDDDFKLVKKYLSSVQGTARTQLVAECEKRLAPPAPSEGIVPQQLSPIVAKRAKKLLKALKKAEKAPESEESD